MEGTARLEFEVGGCRLFFVNVVRFSSKIADFMAIPRVVNKS